MKNKYLLLIILFIVFCGFKSDEIKEVTATSETDPVLTNGDTADDPAIWIHPTNPELSFFIGTNKHSDGHLELYNLDGTRYFSTPSGVMLNNVDLRYNFPMDEDLVDIVVASDITNTQIAVFMVDTLTRTLIDITGNTSVDLINPYGCAMYHNPSTNKFYCFVSDRVSNYNVLQYELNYKEDGRVNANLVRVLNFSSIIEGIVADDQLGFVYFGEEQFGIWKYEAIPESTEPGILIDYTNGQNLTPDVEGLTIYYTNEGSGYLIASSQGSSTYAIYNKEGNNEFICNFLIKRS